MFLINPPIAENQLRAWKLIQDARRGEFHFGEFAVGCVFSSDFPRVPLPPLPLSGVAGIGKVRFGSRISRGKVESMPPLASRLNPIANLFFSITAFVIANVFSKEYKPSKSVGSSPLTVLVGQLICPRSPQTLERPGMGLRHLFR